MRGQGSVGEARQRCPVESRGENVGAGSGGRSNRRSTEAIVQRSTQRGGRRAGQGSTPCWQDGPPGHASLQSRPHGSPAGPAHRHRLCIENFQQRRYAALHQRGTQLPQPALRQLPAPRGGGGAGMGVQPGVGGGAMAGRQLCGAQARCPRGGLNPSQPPPHLPALTSQCPLRTRASPQASRRGRRRASGRAGGRPLAAQHTTCRSCGRSGGQERG